MVDLSYCCFFQVVKGAPFVVLDVLILLKMDKVVQSPVSVYTNIFKSVAYI